MEKILNSLRLELRPLRLDDLDSLAMITSHPGVMKYHYKGPLDREETKALLERLISRYQERGFGHMAVILKETQKFAGICGLTIQNIDDRPCHELAFLFGVAYWGRGLVEEAARRICEYGFSELGVEEIVGIIAKENTGAQALAKRIGLSVKKESVFYGRPVVVFSVSGTDFKRIDL